jgi:hypothetical protein
MALARACYQPNRNTLYTAGYRLGNVLAELAGPSNLAGSP